MLEPARINTRKVRVLLSGFVSVDAGNRSGVPFELEAPNQKIPGEPQKDFWHFLTPRVSLQALP